MRKLTFLFVFLLGSILFTEAIAQSGDHRQQIRETLDIYFQANVDKDYDQILNMIYPRLFEIVSKEEMKGLFTQMEAEGIDYSIKSAETKHISDRVVDDGQQFALVKYTLNIGIRFTGDQYSAPGIQNAMLGTLKAQYGEEKVRLEEATNTFWIQSDNEMFAIAPAGGKDWKFMDKKPGMEAFVGDFIPQEVQDKLTAGGE